VDQLHAMPDRDANHKKNFGKKKKKCKKRGVKPREEKENESQECVTVRRKEDTVQ